jgi:hypothetical protein
MHTIRTLAALALLTATFTAHAACDWNSPGSNPQTGDKAASIENYKDIPPAIRAILKEKIEKKKYDDVATISRNAIRGGNDYTNARDMHWGNNRMCKGEVVRSRWSEKQTHGAMIFTYAGYTIAIASVCGNVFRLDQVSGGSGSASSSTAQETFIPPDAPTAAGNPDSSVTVTATPEESSGGGGGFYFRQREETTWVQWGGSPLPQNPRVTPEPETKLPPMDRTPPAPPFWGRPPVVETPPVFIPVPVTPPVPEPSTYAMMILGLAVLGWKMKRK